MSGRFLACLCGLSLAAALAVLPLASALADPGQPSISNGTTDAAVAPTEAEAREIASQFQHPVTADADTTETQTVAVNPDGSLTATEDSQPVRVRDGSGWVPIDTTLVADAEGAFAPLATSIPFTFSGGGSGPLARVQAASGQWLSESWTAGTLPTPIVSGDTATYQDVYPGVDLRLAAEATGMSEVLVVKTPEAAENPALQSVRLGINGGGLAVSPQAGGVTAADANGAAAITSVAPSWWDSDSPDAGASGPGGTGSTTPLAQTATSTGVSLDVAAAALSPGVAFPVYVDPDWTGPVQGYTFSDSAYPNMSYYNGANSDGYQHVGFIDAANSYDDGVAHTTRSYWKMYTADVAGTHILSAQFKVKEVYASSCQARGVALYSDGAIGPATTWNNPPTQLALQDSKSFAYNYSPDGIGHSSSCPDTDGVGFDATQAVAAAAGASQSAVYLELRAQDPADWLSWKKFSSSASLIITYNHVPDTVVYGMTVAKCSFQCSQPVITRDVAPTLQGVTDDADKGTVLRYDYQVWIGHSASPTTEVRAGSQSGIAKGVVSTWPVSPDLTEGDFEYRVRAYDGVDAGNWSDYFQFTVDSTAPAAPTLTPSGPLSTHADAHTGTVGAGGESVHLVSAVSDHAWGYVYTIKPGAGVGPYPANVSCNSSVSGYTVVCPGDVGASATVPVAAVDTTSTFTAWTFDAAGNAHSAGSVVKFYANSDTSTAASHPMSGHQWRTDDGPLTSAGTPDASPCPQETVADTAASALDAGMNGSTCWSPPTVIQPGHPAVSTLTFDGGTGRVATTSHAVNTSQSFTVAAWLSVTDTSAGRRAISQDGQNEGAFFLQAGNGAWLFCLPDTDATSFSGDCASAPVTLNTWTFVVGVWDAVNKQVRLYVSTDGSVGNAVTASHAAVPASAGSLVIGRAKVGGSYSYWKGSIYHPTVMQGVLSSAQLSSLGQQDAPPSGI